MSTKNTQKSNTPEQNNFSSERLKTAIDVYRSLQKSKKTKKPSLAEVAKSMDISRSTLYKCLEGKKDLSTLEQKTWDRIEILFGKPKSYYFPSNNNELWQYSDKWNEENQVELEQYADDIGFSSYEHFMLFLKNSFQFDELFPVWSPIESNRTEPNLKPGGYVSESLEQIVPLIRQYQKDESVLSYDDYVERNNGQPLYKRLPLLPAADINGLFQVTQNNETYNLSKADIVFLKEFQEKIIDYAKYLLFQHRADMDEIESKVSHDSIDEKGGFAQFHRQKIMEYDPYLKYVCEPLESEDD